MRLLTNYSLILPVLTCPTLGKGETKIESKIFKKQNVPVRQRTQMTRLRQTLTQTPEVQYKSKAWGHYYGNKRR